MYDVNSCPAKGTIKMALHIDITDGKMMERALNRLKATTIPAWGTMHAQQMIEHLVETMEYTNGKKMAVLEIPEEEARSEKLAKVVPDFEIPRNVKGPIPDNTGKKMFKDLPSAIAALKNEIQRFEDHFRMPGQTSVHGAFGPMNYDEWILWHGKHFAHHFTQFGLMQ
jgi:oxepin-CoA hydrolase/3-oxo-5,6-dehydrosuberyl-CoA semialdehyde dehydrogenase